MLLNIPLLLLQHSFIPSPISIIDNKAVKRNVQSSFIIYDACIHPRSHTFIASFIWHGFWSFVRSSRLAKGHHNIKMKISSCRWQESREYRLLNGGFWESLATSLQWWDVRVLCHIRNYVKLVHESKKSTKLCARNFAVFNWIFWKQFPCMDWHHM